MTGLIDKLLEIRNRKFGSRNDTPRTPQQPATRQAAPASGSDMDAGADNDMGKMPFSRKILTALIALAIIIGFWFAMYVIVQLNNKPEDRTRSFTSFAVLVDTAKLDTVQLFVSAQGEASPRTEIDLVPEVGGKIVYVSPNFIEGGLFNKGEVLIRIEDADFNASVIRAQSAVAQAEQVLVREQAEADIARQDYAELGTGTPSALALREPQRREAEAALSSAKAQLDTAKLQLARTAVRAPFAGRVRSKDADIGQYVNPGARLGRIFSTDITQVRLALTNDDMSKLDLPVAFSAKDRASAPGVTLTSDVGGKIRQWNGKIMRTDSSFDTQTRALYAIVEVFDPYGAGASEGGYPLAPGLFVDATITGKVFENVITFKRDGLRPGNEIYLVDETGKGEIRSVEVIDTDEDRAVISAGVAPGEYVILSPMEKSRISIPLRAADYNDPNTVLVTPTNPAANRPAQVDEPKSILERIFPKDDDPDKLSGAEQKDLLAALSATYAQTLRALSDDERSRYRKMNSQEKGEFLASRIAAKTASDTQVNGANSGTRGGASGR